MIDEPAGALTSPAALSVRSQRRARSPLPVCHSAAACALTRYRQVLVSSRGESMFTYGWVLMGGSVLFSLAYLAMIRRGHFDEHRGEDR